jgi:D-glycero-D-manno-heptose 1,7-bisphosphate phosphatase
MSYLVGDVTQSKPTVLIDRDGVINRWSSGGVRQWTDFAFLPGALEALRLLCAAGHPVIVVTNQADVGRGRMRAEDLAAIHRRMQEVVKSHGGEILSVYTCEHAPEHGCLCRKPAPGLLQQAARDYALTLTEAYVIGDNRSDVEAARSVGASSILVLSGKEQYLTDLCPACQPNWCVPGLRDAALLVIERHMRQ